MLSRAEIESQSRLPNLLANTKADNRYCVQLRKNRNIPKLRKECISQLKDVDTKGNPYKSKRLWGDCCKELVLSGHDYKKIIPAHLVKKFEKSVMNTSPVPTAEITSTENSPSTTTPNPRANLNQMRREEAEREGMERQRREMERQRQEMERQQQIQRTSDINNLEEAFRKLTLPTNKKTNNFNKRRTRGQLEVLLRKLESGNKTLTPENRSYIQEVINSSKRKRSLFTRIQKIINLSKHKRSLFTRIKNKLKGRGGGLTKKKRNTQKRKTITNKKKLNTRKRKYNIHKKKLNTRKKKSNTHKRK